MTQRRQSESATTRPNTSPLGSAWTRLSKAVTVTRRADLNYTLLNVLIAGLYALAVVGVYETWITGDAMALFQPIAAIALIAWASSMKRRRKPKPTPLLLVAAGMATTYLVGASFLVPFPEAARMSPIVMLVTAGVLAMVAGGERPVWVGAFVTALAVSSVMAVSISLRFPAGIIVAELSTTVVIMTLVHYVVRSMFDAYESGTSRLSGLMEAAPVAVLEVDLSGVVRPSDKPVQLIREMNPRGFGILNVKPGEASSIRLEHLKPPFTDLIDQVVSSDRLNGETVITLEDRHLLVSWKAFSRRFDRVLFSGMDITAQRMAEAALIEQIEGRDRFIATVSHELRTPLTGVLGLLELVGSGEVDPGEADELLHMALTQTKDMADIVQDLLVAARAANGGLSINAENTDLEVIVDNVMASVDAPFAVDTARMSVARADPVRVRQIIRNLVTNAVRYGGDRRRVVVSSNPVFATIEVRDNGPAPSVEFQQKMFEPYERSATTELPTDSVGLGLTVARTLARLMDGDLTYHHTGEESVFTLSLPRATMWSVA